MFTNQALTTIPHPPLPGRQNRLPRLFWRSPDTLPPAQAGIGVSLHSGLGRRGGNPGWQVGHHTDGLAGGSTVVDGEKRTDQDPEGGRSVTQFLSEKRS
jgi:hypothetical protein